MNTRLKIIVLSAAAGLVLTAPMLLSNTAVSALERPAAQGNLKDQRAKHPRLDKSIAELNQTIAYLEHAPDNFGGHKAKAIAACHTAIAELKEALAHAGEK